MGREPIGIFEMGSGQGTHEILAGGQRHGAHEILGGVQRHGAHAILAGGQRQGIHEIPGGRPRKIRKRRESFPSTDKTQLTPASSLGSMLPSVQFCPGARFEVLDAIQGKQFLKVRRCGLNFAESFVMTPFTDTAGWLHILASKSEVPGRVHVCTRRAGFQA